MKTDRERIADLEHEVGKLGREVDHLRHRTGHMEIMSALHGLSVQIQHGKEQEMADAETILAKVIASNDKMKALQIGVDGLKEGQASIAEEIAALKAANPAVDFTALEAATDETGTIVDGLVAGVGANTPPNT